MRLPEYNVYRRKITDITGGPDDVVMHPTAPIVAMYMESYMPDICPKDENMGYYLTSAEIADELKEMCELSTTEVAVVMLRLGFRMFPGDNGRFVWAMVPPPFSLIEKYKRGGDE